MCKLRSLLVQSVSVYVHFGVEGPPLAASPAAHTVQDGDAGAQVLK